MGQGGLLICAVGSQLIIVAIAERRGDALWRRCERKRGFFGFFPPFVLSMRFVRSRLVGVMILCT